MSILKGERPDITPAQAVAFAFLLISNGLVLVGIDIGPAREEALERIRDGALALLAADVALRGARNYAEAKIVGKAYEANGTGAAHADADVPPLTDESGREFPADDPGEDADLQTGPTTEGDRTPPVQPSQDDRP